MTEKEKLVIQGTDVRWLSRDQIGWLSPTQIGGLSTTQIGGLSRDQIGGLSRDQIGGLSPTQIGWLSPTQIGGLSPTQIGWLSRDQKAIFEEIQKGVPILEKPYTKILEAIQGQGKLEMSTWHTCDTTHCIGGWTCVLTPGGRKFEALFSSPGDAAAQILRVSRPDAPLPNFMASNEAAMAFIEARAAEEA
jgi:hypothetical protein